MTQSPPLSPKHYLRLFLCHVKLPLEHVSTTIRPLSSKIKHFHPTQTFDIYKWLQRKWQWVARLMPATVIITSLPMGLSVCIAQGCAMLGNPPQWGHGLLLGSKLSLIQWANPFQNVPKSGWLVFSVCLPTSFEIEVTILKNISHCSSLLTTVKRK